MRIIRFIKMLYEKNEKKKDVKGIDKLLLVMTQWGDVLKDMLDLVNMSCKGASRETVEELEKYMVTMSRFLEQFYFLLHTVSSNVNIKNEDMDSQIDQISNFNIFNYSKDSI